MFHQNIGTPVRSSTKYFVAVGLILLLVGMGYSVYLYKKASSPIVPEKMTFQQQQLAKPMLKMPPNGDSDRISPDAGQVVIFTGDGFEHHVVYADGNDCIVGNTADSCRDGPILHQYVRDTTGKSNSVTYKFMR